MFCVRLRQAPALLALSRRGMLAVPEVTDWLTDTPIVARPYCPTCEPTADPSREILDVRWCGDHAPVTTGDADGEVAMAWISGSQEAGGEDNRRWCELVHRRPA